MGLVKSSIVTQTFMKVCGKREYMKVVVSMLGIPETFILEIGMGAATLKIHNMHSTWKSSPQGRSSQAASLDLHMHYRREGMAIQNEENIFLLISMGRTMSLMKRKVAAFNFFGTQPYSGDSPRLPL